MYECIYVFMYVCMYVSQYYYIWAAIGYAVIRYNLLQRLLEGYLFLQVSSRLMGTHPLKIPFSPIGATSYGYLPFILSFSLLVWILPFLPIHIFSFQASCFLHDCPLNFGPYYHKQLA